MYGSRVTKAQQLGDVDSIFNWITNAAGSVATVAGKVRLAAPQVQDVVQGRKDVAVVPKDQSAFIFQGTQYGIPSWAPVALIAGLTYMAFKKRR
jgi:hypothetical protein